MLIGMKGLLRRTLPPGLRSLLRDGLEDLRDWLSVLRFGLGFVATRRPRPQLLLYFGFALGDDLLSTAVLRELRKRAKDRLLMVSDHPELFTGNDDVSYVRPLWRRYYPDRSTVAVCRRFTRIWGGAFARLEYAPMAEGDRRKVPAHHIIAEMCARAGVTGAVSIRPYLSLTEAEKGSMNWAGDKIVIQSSGMAARHPMRNKQWPVERFQGVVDSLRGSCDFIQLGSPGDPPLRHVQDLRGATDVRGSAAVLHNARLYVGTVGFLMHLARAVECPSVIVFGGREAPWQSGYVCNANLYSAVPCAPCWQSHSCAFDRRCMSEISVADVVAAITQMLGRPRNPLPVEMVEIDAAARQG